MVCAGGIFIRSKLIPSSCLGGIALKKKTVLYCGMALLLLISFLVYKQTIGAPVIGTATGPERECLMKQVRPNTFIRERAGLVTVLRFIGYFQGRGYESMQLYTWPLYITSIGFGCTNDLPFSAYHTPRYLAMSRYPNWGISKPQLIGSADLKPPRRRPVNRWTGS